ncbi:efflux transporter outer membrane subunit [Pseudomonas sp. NPDC078700]|uniref:efflux transporter outer membrane subunit n=1 Tax=Pseudomonas sp. NPDC078700 TaxID=3364424 RepID=UPI0037C985C3
MNHGFLLLTAILALPGCTGQEPIKTERPAAPERWQHAPLTQVQISPNWWQQFASSELDQLVEQALLNNYDLSAAVARVQQAQANARIAGAPLLPKLDGNIGASRNGRFDDSSELEGGRYFTGLAASYEVDLWGRLRAEDDSALASLRASQYDRAALQITLSASVVSSWLQQVGLQQRLRIAQLNLSNAERVLAIVESRQLAGAATNLELAQQRGIVAQQQRSLASIRQQSDDSKATLAVLLGLTNSNQLVLTEQQLERLQLPDIDAGIPSQLLLQRPDLARAEAQLAAAEANVNAARAALLPRLNLSAAVDSNVGHASDLLSNPIYSLSAALLAPIFDGGRLNAEHDLAKALRSELLANYQASIVSAFADVQLALNALAGIDAQLQAQVQVEQQAILALRLSEERYRAGAETLLTLLDTQRTLYTAQDDTALLQLARLQAGAALNRAMGGGWQTEDQQLSALEAH